MQHIPNLAAALQRCQQRFTASGNRFVLVQRQHDDHLQHGLAMLAHCGRAAAQQIHRHVGQFEAHQTCLVAAVLQQSPENGLLHAPHGRLQPGARSRRCGDRRTGRIQNVRRLRGRCRCRFEQSSKIFGLRNTARKIPGLLVVVLEHQAHETAQQPQGGHLQCQRLFHIALDQPQQHSAHLRHHLVHVLGHQLAQFRIVRIGLRVHIEADRQQTADGGQPNALVALGRIAQLQGNVYDLTDQRPMLSRGVQLVAHLRGQSGEGGVQALAGGQF